MAFLTQDAEPADEHWLQRLLSGFELADDVALVYGPYRPRPDASPAVRLELEQWFRSLSADGAASVERLAPQERTLAAAALVGRRGFFSDVNACISRAAWQRVPFREIPYAEDRALALDMLRAGYAKAFVPDAIVLHSHAYTSMQQLRRCFDEWRGLLEVYGWREPASPGSPAAPAEGRASERAQGAAPRAGAARARAWRRSRRSLRHQLVCRAGALLGSRADRLAPGGAAQALAGGTRGLRRRSRTRRQADSGEPAAGMSENPL